MQRSRKALRQRRVSDNVSIGKGRFCKLTMSLVFVLWFLSFSSLWITHGNSQKDESADDLVRVPTWNSDQLEDKTEPTDEYPPGDSNNLHSNEGSCINQDEFGGPRTENIVSFEETALKEDKDNVSLEQNEDKIFSAVQSEVNSTSSENDTENSTKKLERLARAVPRGLDEFKSKAFSSKNKSLAVQVSGVTHRMEPGGEEYNYASSSKGAKVLASNKEAKGASSILTRDKDKYLINPCSVEEKYIVIELSEETLVATIKIANFEHHSSNLKDFELLGSLAYPTDSWFNLGNFSAANVKHTQSFPLQEPKWVRYLRLNLLSHFGSEFYCTLSIMEVYGVDAVERMLEDLISAQDNLYVKEEEKDGLEEKATQTESTEGDDLEGSFLHKTDSEPSAESNLFKPDIVKTKLPDPVEEIRHQQTSRMPGDTVLKILMQKVRSLDLTLSVLEKYLEELNSRYGSIFKELDNELGEKETLMEKIKLDIQTLLDAKELLAKDVNDLVTWKGAVSLQLETVATQNDLLRLKVENVRQEQVSIEQKGIVVFITCLVFGFVGVVRVLLSVLLSLVEAVSGKTREEKTRKFCGLSCSWLFLLLSCTIMLFVLSI